MQRLAVFDGELGHLRLAHGLHAQLAHALVEALGKQAVDHFFANLGRETAPDHRLGNLAGAKAGDLGVLLIIPHHSAEGLRDLFGRNVEHQLAGAIRIQNRAVLMVMFVVVFVIMASMRVRLLGRFRMRIVFESVGRTQRFAFRARQAPNYCHSGLTLEACSAVWLGKFLISW